MSDYKGAALMLDALPKAKALLGDRGYDADWLRQALTERGIEPCIPSKINRKVPIPHDRTLYRQRHRIENMFGRLKPVLSACLAGSRRGLAPHPHPLRPMRPHLHVGNLHRRNRHLLALINES